MIVLAILFPPLYFFINKKVGIGLLTGAMFILSFFLALTIALIPVSLILWVIAMIPAALHCRRQEINKNMARHADLIATKLSDKLPQPKVPPPAPPQTIK